MGRIFLITIYASLIFLCTAEYKSVNTAAAPAEKTLSAELRVLLNDSLESKNITFGDKVYQASPLLNKLYKSRQYNLIWFKEDMSSGEYLSPGRHLFSYLEVLRDSKLEGLDPNFYDIESIEKNINEMKDLEGDILRSRAVQVDLLISNSNISYFIDLLYGRYEVASNFIERDYFESYIDIIALIDRAVSENNFSGAVRALLPDSYFYHALKRSLIRYENIKENGGLHPIPLGENLQLGVYDVRVVFLKHRLYTTGDIDFKLNEEGKRYLNDPLFDYRLIKAVKRFQRRHGLKADSVVGENTIAAMNVPLSEKIDSIKRNLDIWRKLPRNFGDRYVMVNIPVFRLFAVKDNTPVLEMSAIVGTPDWNTPVLIDDIEYVAINPYWNIPKSIFSEEVLPIIRSDPSYLAKANLEVLSLETDIVQKDYSWDWSEVDPENFNYRLRQLPGGTNPLGKLKFLFPNKYNVYLHDTPHRQFFDQLDKKLSHGCIRVEKPVQLAEFIFDYDSEWNAEVIRSQIDSGQSWEIQLDRSVPVYIVYFTTWVGDDGLTYFSDDFYNFLTPVQEVQEVQEN